MKSSKKHIIIKFLLLATFSLSDSLLAAQPNNSTQGNSIFGVLGSLFFAGINKSKEEQWFEAAKKGDVAYLKSQGDKIDLEAQVQYGNRALDLAAYNEELACLKYLVEKEQI